VTRLDIAGRPARQPGQPATGTRQERRRQAALARRRSYWQQRIQAAGTPLALLRVVADKAQAAMVQRERAALTGLGHAEKTRNARWVAAAQARLQTAQAEIHADVARLTDELAKVADKHEYAHAQGLIPHGRRESRR
jgi:hypothetical protein